MKEVKKEIANALAFLGQAQEAAPSQSDLWKELGQQYDTLDTLLTGLDEGDYNQDGSLR
jgi:hypothetical protein